MIKILVSIFCCFLLCGCGYTSFSVIPLSQEEIANIENMVNKLICDYVESEYNIIHDIGYIHIKDGIFSAKFSGYFTVISSLHILNNELISANYGNVDPPIIYLAFVVNVEEGKILAYKNYELYLCKDIDIIEEDYLRKSIEVSLRSRGEF